MNVQAMTSPWSVSVQLSTVLLFLAAETALAAQQNKKLAVVADVEIQAIIKRVIYGKGEDDAETREAMKKLKELARKAPEILAPQLLHYDIHASNEKEGIGMMAMMGYFARENGSELRQAIYPYLEASDAKVRDKAIRWLRNIDIGSTIDSEANLMSYRECLLGQKEAPPPGLVDYVFDVSPRRALLMFGDVYSEKPKFGEFPRVLLWSEHQISIIKWRFFNRFLQPGDLDKAKSELDGLSKNEGWHVRRYVVELVREVPEFATVEMVNRLKKDPHPLVAAPAKRLK